MTHRIPVAGSSWLHRESFSLKRFPSVGRAVSPDFFLRAERRYTTISRHRAVAAFGFKEVKRGALGWGDVSLDPLRISGLRFGS